MDLSQRDVYDGETIAQYISEFHYLLEDDGIGLGRCIVNGEIGYGF